MTFKDWLKTRKITDSPRGDFIADALRTKDFPDIQEVSEMHVLLAHMRVRGAHPAAIRTAKAAFREWVQAECVP